MRKEAVNLFSEGLIMDLNPITTPNNVMTSCLNGTLITFNGNEFVLQNDMGNGRVESAYLPAGYVPVGMVEFGGIIYIASYNPLTNYSQLGSFPSPERNISSNELSDADKYITPSNFDNPFSTTYKLNLFSGSDDLVLRSGDKFSIIVAASGGWDTLRLYLSNYDNTIGDYIISPKNKTLTLTVAVIDSNNNLRDITSLLKRLDSNGDEIEFDDEASEDYKLNSGYWAYPTVVSTSTDLDTYRSVTALNVYNNKVFGELYIVATLNTVERIDLTITGEKSEDGTTASLQIVITYYYNCPDGFYDQDSLSNLDSRYTDLYSKYYCIYGRSQDFASSSSLIKGFHFTLTAASSSTSYVIDNDYAFTIDSLDDVSYSEDDKLYTVINTINIDSIAIDTSLANDVRAYTLVPEMTYGSLTGLEVDGTINLTKLGTGEIELNTWKYYCTSSVITLGWGFEAYLKTGQSVEELVFEFYDAETLQLVYSYTPTKKYSYNGVFTDVLGYSDLEYLKLYLTVIKLKLNTYDDEGNQETRTYYRWLMTTSLYNKQYFSIDDYSTFTDELLHTEDYTGLHDINLVFNGTATDYASENTSISDTYSPNDTSEYEILMAYRKNIKTYKLSGTLSIENEDKYPFTIDTDVFEVTYEADNENTTIEWNGIVSGLGEYPNEIDTTEISHELEDWESEDTDLYQNVAYVEIEDNKLIIKYKVLSFIYGIKDSGTSVVTYSVALTQYGSADRLPGILGSYSSTTNASRPPYALQLYFREHQRSLGKSDRHGYGFIPILYVSSWTLMVEYDDYEDYVSTDSTDATVTYYLAKEWSLNITAGVQSIFATPPIILMVTRRTCTSDFATHWEYDLGYMRRTNTTSEIKELILWYNGNNYGMLDGYSNSGSFSLYATLLLELEQLYIRQTDAVEVNAYLINPTSSSYVSSGTATITTLVNYSVEGEVEDALPDYINNIEDTINTIISNAGETIESDELSELVRLMTFYVNTDINSTLDVSFEISLYDMSDLFADIQTIYSNPTVNSAVVIGSDGTVYTKCDGNSISSSSIYTILSNTLMLASAYSSLAKYSSTMQVKLINDAEYHLIPKSLNTGTPKIDAESDGSSDSNSILNFYGIPVINMQIGSSTILS